MKRLLYALVLACTLVAEVASAQSGGNIQGTLLASVARTTTPIVSTDQSNYMWKCATITINVSAFTAGTYTPTIQGKDPVSGTYYTILTGAAIAGTGLTVLKVCPGITVAANLSVADVLPRTWRISLVGGAGQSMTFSVGLMLNQ